MGGESKLARRIAKNIVAREGGTFAVDIRVDGVNMRKSFPSLDEAVTWRDTQKATRKPREKRGAGDDYLMSVESTELRNATRERIANAPRTTEIIDGRTWTVVHLPPVNPTGVNHPTRMRHIERRAQHAVTNHGGMQ